MATDQLIILGYKLIVYEKGDLVTKKNANSKSTIGAVWLYMIKML